MSASDAISFRNDLLASPASTPVVEPVVVDYDNPAHKKWVAPTRRLILPATRESRVDGWIWTIIAIGIAALYLYALLCFWAPANPGTDQNGYFAGGRQFAHTLSSGLKPESDFNFIGRMWVTAPSGVNYPKYPLGLPILFSLCIWIFGDAGYTYAHYVSPVASALAVLGVYALTRRIAGSFMGVMAMLLLACSQVMLTLAVNPNSHAACTCAVVWGMFFLIRWLESGAVWRGILAGAFFGFAYMIRYTEGLMLLPLGVAMIYAARWALPSIKRLAITFAAALAVVALGVGFWLITGEQHMAEWGWLSPLGGEIGHTRPFPMLVFAVGFATIVSAFIAPRSLVRLLAVGLAWLIPVAYLTIYNMVEMRSFTSYAGTNESTGFAMSYFFANWEKMIRVVHDQGLFFTAPIGVLGLVCMFRRLPLAATLLTLWLMPSVLLYTAYYWAPDMMGVAYSRFVLTQLPALMIAAAWLLGEIARRMSGAGVPMNRLARLGLELCAIVGGIALIGFGMWTFSPRHDSEWWDIVVPGAISLIVGAAGLLSRFGEGLRIGVARQFHGATPRLGIALVVFIATGLGVWRTVLGAEWGQRLNIRANMEIQARQNMNLAGLGDAVRDAVDGSPKEKAQRVAKDDSDVLLFGDGERLNHFQWIGGWQLFSTDAFNYERATRQLSRNIDENDPDPIDPSRIKFLQGVYKGKDQRSLQADQNALIAGALAKGRRVYYVLPDQASKVFGRQIDRRQFDVVPVGSYSDMVSPRTDDDFVPPSERPKQPVNRFGRGNAFAGPNFLGNERQTYRIGKIVLKPTSATQPATQATTQPTTQKVQKAG